MRFPSTWPFVSPTSLSIIPGKSSDPQLPPILRLSRLSSLSMGRRDQPRGGPEEAPLNPASHPRAAAPRALRAPWTEMAPDPGLLRATKGVGESQTQLRWVSRAHRCPPQAHTPRLWARIQARGDLGLQLKENPTVNYFCSM